jgi:hypothetical protein
MRRPPYARWLVAVGLVAIAAFVDLVGPPTHAHPYVVAAIASGASVATSDLEWRDVPAGVLPPVDLSGSVATRDLEPGTPLLPGDLAERSAIPAGWWVVPLPIPGDPVPGTAIRVVLTETSTTVDGIVVAAGTEDLFSSQPTGLAAVPAGSAAAVAAAAVNQQVVVLLSP